MAKHRIEIDHANRLNRVRVLDQQELHETIAMFRALFAMPEFNPEYGTLHDVTGTSRHHIDPATLKQMNAFFAAEDPRTGPVAVVLGDSNGERYFGRYIEARREADGLTKIRDLRTFANAEEAETWLKVHLRTTAGNHCNGTTS
jgi:hypothetical protein